MDKWRLRLCGNEGSHTIVTASSFAVCKAAMDDDARYFRGTVRKSHLDSSSSEVCYDIIVAGRVLDDEWYIIEQIA